PRPPQGARATGADADVFASDPSLHRGDKKPRECPWRYRMNWHSRRRHCLLDLGRAHTESSSTTTDRCVPRPITCSQLVHTSLAFLGARMTRATVGVSAGETIWAFLLKWQERRSRFSLPDHDPGHRRRPPPLRSGCKRCRETLRKLCPELRHPRRLTGSHYRSRNSGLCHVRPSASDEAIARDTAAARPPTRAHICRWSRAILARVARRTSLGLCPRSRSDRLHEKQCGRAWAVIGVPVAARVAALSQSLIRDDGITTGLSAHGQVRARSPGGLDEGADTRELGGCPMCGAVCVCGTVLGAAAGVTLRPGWR